MWDAKYPSFDEWEILLDSLESERFPHLQKVHIIVISPGEDIRWFEDLGVNHDVNNTTCLYSILDELWEGIEAGYWDNLDIILDLEEDNSRESLM